MPNRILKESICTSEEIDGLSAFQETVFYRLIVNCDDFGRMDARPKILASRLFPLKDIRAAQMEDALRALTSAELVTLYEVNGKPFLQMKTWDRHQQVRAQKSKYPGADDTDSHPLQADDINGNQLISDDSKCPRNRNRESISESESETGVVRAGARETAREIAAEAMKDRSPELQQAVQDWLAYKKERREGYRATGLQSMLTQILNNAQEFGDTAMAGIIRESMGSGYKGIMFDRLKKAKTGRKPVSAAEYEKSQGHVTEADYAFPTRL